MFCGLHNCPVTEARWAESQSKCGIPWETIAEGRWLHVTSIVLWQRPNGSSHNQMWQAVMLSSKKNCVLTNDYNFWPSDKHSILTKCFWGFIGWVKLCLSDQKVMGWNQERLSTYARERLWITESNSCFTQRKIWKLFKLFKFLKRNSELYSSSKEGYLVKT